MINCEGAIDKDIKKSTTKLSHKRQILFYFNEASSVNSDSAAAEK